MVFATFNPWKWVLVYTVPEDLRDKTVNDIQRNLIVIVAISMLTAAILIYFFIEKSFRPLEELVTLTKSATKGIFKQIDDVKFNDDELGILVKAFNKMSTELHDYVDSLQREVNERQAAEGKITFQKALLESGQEAAIDGIMFTDRSGNIVSYNQRLVSIFNIPEEIIKTGKEGDIIDFITKEIVNMEIFRKCLQEISHDITHSHHEILNLKNSNIIDFYTASIKSKNHDIFGRGWYFRDITNRKRAEQERDTLMENLAIKNEELESIIYVTSHDLRSPLVNMHGFSNELRLECADLNDILAKCSLPEKEKNEIHTIVQKNIPTALQFIESSTKKMDGLLKGLLRLSRLGRAALKIEPLDMNTMLEDIRKTMQFQIRELDVELIVEPLPQCKGDYSQINQVFTNLIDNAIKYRDENRKPRIKITGKAQFDFIIYAVEDNGVGIKDNHQEKIFEIFHRLNPKSSIDGDGLGLPIVRRILDRNGGTISIKSEEGRGSCFYISLPKA